MTTPEERMYRFMDENLDQFRKKTLDEIILAHRTHEHEMTKAQFFEEISLDSETENNK